MKQYTYADLMSIPDIQQLLQSFYSYSGIPTEILNLDGQSVLAVSGPNIRGSFDQNFASARELDDQIGGELVSNSNELPIKRFKNTAASFTYACPIRVENQDLAMLVLGPIIHTQPDEDRLRQTAQESGFDEAAFEEEIRGVPIRSEAQAKGCLEFLIQCIQPLAHKSLNERRLIAANDSAKKALEKQEAAYRQLEQRIQERTEELESANAALQESVQRFRVALMDTPVTVFNQDLDLRYTWIYNPHNYANQPVDGKCDADLFTADDAMRLTALKRRVIGAGLLTREEVSLTVGAQTLVYDMTLDPLYDANGAVTGLTCAATEITERKQIEEEIQRRLAESEGIRRIAKGLLQKIGLDEVLEIVCTEAMNLTGARGSVVLLLDDEGWLRLQHRAGYPIYTLDRLPVEGSLAGQAIQTGSLVWANRLENEHAEAANQWQGYPWTPGLLSMLSVPLKVDAQTIGVLNILDKPGELTQEDMRIIDLFADQAAVIIEHVRLQDRAEQFAVLEERQHLARELHDSVTQALYSVTLYADAGLRAYTRKQWDALERNLHEARNMAREAMYDMRLLIFELRPAMLEREGLVSALRSRLAAVETHAGLKTRFIVEDERRLAIGIEEQIYRITQEALNNVVKHARASFVHIQIKYQQDAVQLEVMDDGLGFDPENVESGGIGLQGIQERVQQSGGRLKIESAVDKGTCLTVIIPTNTRD